MRERARETLYIVILAAITILEKIGQHLKRVVTAVYSFVTWEESTILL